MTKKKCYKCKEIKEFDCFYVDKSKKDGLTNLCKKCYKEKYEVEREKRLAYKKKYAETHKEEISNYFKEYHQKHKKATIKICAKCNNPFEAFKEGGNKYYNDCQIKIRQKKNNIKTCVICSANFGSKNSNALYCERCQVIKKREKGRRNVATFKKNHPERVKETKQKYYKEKGKDLAKEKWEETKANRTPKLCEICGSVIDSKLHIYKYCKECKFKILKIRQHKREAKRRSLNYKTLNNPFPNSEGHHLNKNEVMFIPKELHRSVIHKVFTDKNMNIINALAWKWYFENEI